MSNQAKKSVSPFIKPLVAIFALLFLFLLVQWVVNFYQKPGHMGVIESQSMSMAVQPPAGAMPVQTVIVKAEPFTARVTYTGNAVAYNDIAIFPRVTGLIITMPVYPGDRVAAGQLLAQLDTQELNFRVQEAQSGYQAATQQYQATLSQQDQAAAQMQRAKDAIESAQANLAYRQAQVHRSRTLVKEAVITQEEAQKDEADFRTAQSQYKQALAELKAAQHGFSSSQYLRKAQHAQAAQAKAALHTQAVIRNYTQITAPQAGVVTQRLISPGTLVNPGMNILQMAQINPIRIQANVAESDVSRIQRGASVLIWNQKSKSPIGATITAIFPRADLQTRTTVVEAVVPNAQELFFPGDLVSMSIQTGKKTDSLTVPNAAIIQRNQQQAVWIVQDGKAHLQYVTTGDTNDKHTAIIQGLRSRDEVIIRGSQNLSEGDLVTSGDYGPEGLKALPKPVITNRLSPDNRYQLQKNVGMYLATINLEKQPPKAGNNNLLVTVQSAPGMSMPLNHVNIEAKNQMPSMAEMPVPKPTLQKIENGKFRVQMDWVMGGLWQVILTIRNGDETIGVLPIEIEVAD